MSSLWKKPTFTPRSNENHWVNTIFESHDLFCSCEDPWLHLLDVLNRQGNARKPLKDINNIKCLLTGTPGTEKEDIPDAIDGLNPGDLEKLFEKDTEPEDTAEDTR
nr:MAG: hypothetical protein [Betatorquevirus sp.]